VLEAFPDGVFVVNLAPIGDPTLVSRLRGTRTLLLLDNFELVVETVPHVTALLEAGTVGLFLELELAAARILGLPLHYGSGPTLPWF
jgi:hypothetical protein